ncbi:MAG: Mov34/MPN/PAD-1 family protein [Alphaproteobacteria bacterium]|nr:Mov34/MPN/PAD-1 family protein [Alphaproteobacteria bacterium]MBU1516559.1 Mov34/MPN/PAD-1 family protein [Alphaproteobacteria bacterium]MBU2094316.1 Mov34/MPN/PAD-1 family protein [Alphaproteobacteria bacterium]MBU2154107.1 Mov34/MPN/PAD-1 family protein [Alphaproteobacteria bacterium]MBU2307486.1 Mov34/MPN/PAD-1 family protein [Alphaproteobacteria bacterium]
MKVELDDTVRRRMRERLRKAGRREIGGVLMAEQVAVDHFKIIDFSVDDQTGSYAHFVRSPERHKAALDAFFARTSADYERFNYLGEWHSHPSFSVQPSTEDCASMVSLVHGERDIHFAFLVIVKLQLWTSLQYSITLFVRNVGCSA